MNDDKDGCITYVILTAIGLFAYIIFLANGGSDSISSSSSSTGSTYGRPWKKKLQEYERQKAEKKNQELLYQNMMRNTQMYHNVSEPQSAIRHSSSISPDDTYDEGYEEGYEQGRKDEANGYMHGYGYDDTSSYYDHYDTKYQEGYEDGYDDGYSNGQSEYDEKKGEDD